jgi:hypothetical protein
MCGRPEGNSSGAASGGDGQRLMVREGGTRRHGARGSDGELGGGPRVALKGGSTAAEQGGRKKGCSRGGWPPFIAGIDSGQRRHGGESGGRETAAGNQRCRRCHGSDKLPVERAAAVRPVGSGHFNRVGWYCRHGLSSIRCKFFSNYSNFAPILKYKTKTILMSINVQTWYGTIVDCSKQLLLLGPLPIPNRIPVIKFGTNSTLNLSLNF